MLALIVQFSFNVPVDSLTFFPPSFIPIPPITCFSELTFARAKAVIVFDGAYAVDQQIGLHTEWYNAPPLAMQSCKLLGRREPSCIRCQRTF